MSDHQPKPYRVIYWRNRGDVKSWCDEPAEATSVQIEFGSSPHYLRWEFELPKDKFKFCKMRHMLDTAIEFGKAQRSTEIGRMMKGLISL